MSPRDRIELAGEAHHVDERRAQVVADDVGEALDLVVGVLQLADTIGDDRLEVLVGVAQLVLRGEQGAGRATARRGNRVAREKRDDDDQFRSSDAPASR